MRIRDNPLYRYGMRRHQEFWYIGVALLVGALMFAAGFLTWRPPPADPDIGPREIYLVVLCVTGALWVFVIMPAVSPLLFAREFERRTYESLRATLLTERGIIAGALAVALVPFYTYLAASLIGSVYAAAVHDIPALWLIAAYAAIAIHGTTNAFVGLWTGVWMKRGAPAVLMCYASALILLPALVAAAIWGTWAVGRRISVHPVPFGWRFWRGYTCYIAVLLLSAAAARAAAIRAIGTRAPHD